MLKTIAIRGKRDIVAVFSKYAQISGKQDTGRPKATADFIEYVSEMPLNGNTVLKLKNASKQHIIDDIEEATWEKAMSVFRYAFSLKGNPQMPYFLRVAGTACIRNIEEQDSVSVACVQKVSDKEKSDKILEQFKILNIDEKLNEIYKLLLERG